MPNRILRDSALGSKKLAAVSAEAERLYWRLIMVADDFGRFDADPPVLLSKCFPRHRDYNVRQVLRWFREIVGVGLVVPYTVNGDEIGEIVGWAKYQRARNTKSKFPAPPDQPAAIRRELPQLAAVSRPVVDVVVVEDVDVVKQDLCAPQNGARPSAEAFERFWNAYPKDRRRGKFEARKAWAGLKLSEKRVADIMASLESWKQSTDWTKDGGKFIPWPEKFLRKHRWEETPEPQSDGLFTEAERRFMSWKPSGGPKPV